MLVRKDFKELPYILLHACTLRCPVVAPSYLTFEFLLYQEAFIKCKLCWPSDSWENLLKNFYIYFPCKSFILHCGPTLPRGHDFNGLKSAIYLEVLMYQPFLAQWFFRNFLNDPNSIFGFLWLFPFWMDNTLNIGQTFSPNFVYYG